MGSLEKRRSSLKTIRYISEPRTCASEARIRAIDGAVLASNTGVPLPEVQNFNLRLARLTV